MRVIALLWIKSISVTWTLSDLKNEFIPPFSHWVPSHVSKLSSSWDVNQSDHLYQGPDGYLKPGFQMICNGWRLSTIMIGNQSASCPQHMETPKTLSQTVCDTRSEWSEELNLILLSRPLRPRRQKKILMERASGKVCDNRRYIIVPLKSRDSNYPMRTETFATIFKPNILRFVGLLKLWSPKK